MPAPRRPTIAGLPNVLQAAVVTITAGAEGADMLANNLKDWQHPSQLAELTSVFPHLAHWTMDAGPDPIEKVRVLGLGRYDTLVPGDQMRIVTVASGVLPAVRSQTLPPSATESSSNVTSTDHTRVNEHPSSPDGSLIGSSNGLSVATIRFSFSSPSSSLALDGDYQCFLIWAVLDQDAIGVDVAPRYTARLYESGALVAELGTKTVTLAAGQLLIFPWDASLLANPDGSGVEIEIEMSTWTAPIAPSIDAVSWEVLHQTDLDAVDTDSGWITITGAEPEEDFGDTALDDTGLIPRIYRKYSDNISVQQMRVEFRADGLGYFTSFLKTPPRTPATFIDAGFLICHPVWESPNGVMDGPELGTIPHYVGEEQAIDGSSHRVLQSQQRTLAVAFNHMARSKAEALFRRLNLAASGEDALLVTMYPGEQGNDEGDINTMLCIADRLDSHVLSNFYRDDEPTSRSFGYAFIEHLG